MRAFHLMRGAMFFLALVLGIPGLTVSAHHSMAGYDSTREITLQGIVTEYKWRNPHVWLVWEVKDTTGKVIPWVGELPAINTNLSLGMTKNSVKPGDEVAVTVNPAKLGTPEGRVWKIVKRDGTVVMDMSIRFQKEIFQEPAPQK